MVSDNANSLKEDGNVKFKQRLFREASDLYAKAEIACPEAAVYPSNLSASLYELGDYASASEAIIRAAKNLSEPERSSSMFHRLSTRLARTLSHGVRAGTIPSEFFQDNVVEVKELSQSTQDESAGNELLTAWKDWTRVESESDGVLQGAADARSRHSCLPLAKPAAAACLAYYSIGHDHPLSIVDDWGDRGHASSKDPLKISHLPEEELSNLAFLFGGVGDARHVFGSIIGLHQAYQKLDETKRSVMKIHLTLLDIHPTALARDVCIFQLLDELKEGGHAEETAAEIKATLFYIFIGIIMPSYCHKRFHQTVKDLIQNLENSPPILPSWLHIVDMSIPAILRSLHYWDSGMEKPSRTTPEMLKYHIFTKNVKELMDESELDTSDVAKILANHPSFITNKRMLDGVSDEQVISMLSSRMSEPCPSRDQAEEQKTWLQEARDMMAGAMAMQQDYVSGVPNTPTEFTLEAKWYDELKAFVLPAILRARHPGFDELWKNVSTSQPKSTLKDPFEQAKVHINEEWKPNSSLFDAIFDLGHHYPEFNYNIISTAMKDLSDFNKRLNLVGAHFPLNSDCPVFSTVEIFFDAVIRGLTALDRHIKLEVLQGSLISDLSRMKAGTDSKRPTEFPRRYTRMWLSNVPDYTHGMLNTAVYAVPNLQKVPGAVVACNTLLNSQVWKDAEEFCHTYTLLLRKDIPRFLGCRILQLEPRSGLTKLQAMDLPRPLVELASKEELTTWLTRILINILVPGVTSQTQIESVYYPNNLVTLIDLLVHLHAVGFPGHWLSSFLGSILSDNLVSDVAPYLGTLPNSVSEYHRRVPARRLNLCPWHSDFENILATSYEALPFPVLSIPLGFTTSHTDVKTFRVNTPRRSFKQTTANNMHNGAYPVMSLLFFDPRKDSPDKLASSIAAILEGKLGKNGSVHVLTVIDGFDIFEGFIRWRMSGERVKKMKEEGWVMAPYRSDVRESVLYQSVPAANWIEVDGF
ncbi:hypothetical protein BXZ70DRAFT_935376 [Cristinia sonorae]|uniref:DUF4470 domain-containing protein n=1 Tax=Cristinia sonorae TaxID=1940300 RepID=A0A8K0UQQ3_9AGAR|nr:hypothetical protein BXZ70DRAFT_935376 [Cristinia sonorae]